MLRHAYISIMGTMGSGKTTAAKFIADFLGYRLIEENFEENVFLPRFYEHMTRWAFHSQIFFLMEKIKQTRKIAMLRRKKSVVQDTPLYQDIFSYAQAQQILGNMDKAEWLLYQKIYRQFEETLPKPDCILFLSASIPELVRRISSRGREYEKAVETEYISLLDRLNREWLSSQKAIPVQIIETDSLNIVADERARREFFHQIRKAI